ncbi:unnamed protein product [Diamesa tonsa]
MRVYNVLIIFTIFIVIKTVSCVDWTLNCSLSCQCKWINGKKSALCNALSLTQIPTNLSTEIQVLMMNENNIQILNREEFTTLGLINLQKIYLKKSNIKYLHRETFKNLKILVELDLSENLIEQLDKQTFSGNDRLRILFLYSNPIKQLIADQFPVLPYLRTIDLHNCQINRIDETTFSNVDLLEYLNLKQNSLQSLPGNTFTHMKNLKTLLLEENPWNCDCQLKNFRNWYVKNNHGRISLQCKTPFSMLNQNWEIVEEDAFGCAPTLRIMKEDIHLSDLESNITFRCFTTGDPKPTIAWELDGKEIENDNVVIENEDSAMAAVVSSLDQQDHQQQQQHQNGNKIWSNLSIYNITNLNAGFYTCFARNDIGYASQNISLILPEVIDHVAIKNSDTFWYFGLILGIFGTIISFLLISIMFCVCRKLARRRKHRKNIKNSVSFNDQEKKLLDLSITTTTNDRDRDYNEMLNTPSSTGATHKSDSSIIALEPVQITIENFHHPHSLQHHLQHHNNGRRMGDEFPLNISLFPPPPPEFCTSTAQSSLMTTSSTNGQLHLHNNNHMSSSLHNQLRQQHQHQQHQQQQQQHLPLTTNKPPFGNIFISVSVTQDAIDNDSNMYPDLLNIPNRIKNSLTANNLSSSLVTTSLASSTIQPLNQTTITSTTLPISQPTPSLIATSTIVPINIESYATLPRNKLLSSASSTSSSSSASGSFKQPVSILKQTKKNYDNKQRNNGLMESENCMSAGLIISGNNSDISNKCVSCNINSRHDNMGPRYTASGNSTLSIPDEEREEQENLQQQKIQTSQQQHQQLQQPREQLSSPDQLLNHHNNSYRLHHHHQQQQQHSPTEQLSPQNQIPSSTNLLMPSDFVSL